MLRPRHAPTGSAPLGCPQSWKKHREQSEKATGQTRYARRSELPSRLWLTDAGGRIHYGSASCFAPYIFYRYMPDTTPATALTDTAAAPVAAPQPTPKARRRRPPTLSWSALEAVHERGAPLLAGRPETHGLGLLALLVGLMVLETQLAVMLIDKTGELTSALAAKQVHRFWSAVRASLMVVAVAVPVYAFYY